MSTGHHVSKKERVSASGCPCLSMHRLEVSLYSIPGHGQIACTLWRLTADPLRGGWMPVYAVGMAGLGYRRLMLLGRDEGSARTMYALLVRHTVTPCALGDVLEEIADPSGR